MTDDRPRIGIVADFLEERWPSMDLVAEMLMTHLERSPVRPQLLRPTLSRRLSVLASRGDRVLTSDRIINRFWDYPAWLRARTDAAEVFHVVDHSYAHLSAELPAGRVVVTCHDTDAFRPLVEPGHRESRLPRFLSQRILRGLQRADVVACVSETTRRELLEWKLVPAERTTVIPNGVHACYSAQPEASGDAAAAALLGHGESLDLLHVGSTIPRKRIDVLLRVLQRVHTKRPHARLLRVGGGFTPAQERLARELGVDRRIAVLPFVDRSTLAALYRRAALVLLPSEREGFGLPLIEALASGTPVVATDLPVLREVGAGAATYAPLADVDAWSDAVDRLLEERASDAAAWSARRVMCATRARDFSWERSAAGMVEIYQRLLGIEPQATLRAAAGLPR